MWVKICGNTSLEDALYAVEAGADAVGFVFAPSVRQVNAAQVQAIVAGLPKGIETVGVFAGDDAEEIAQAVEESGLATVQLHGGVRLELALRLAKRLPGIGIIPTVSWTVGGGDEPEAARQVDEVAAAPEGYRLLVDSKVGSASGGTGRRFDWEQARGVLTRHADLRVIVAGGLKPENVGDAVRVLRPWGVDVSSGVEQSPGKKDREKVLGFVRAARETSG
jgi:phosphoribosylanthranilate isomerase